MQSFRRFKFTRDHALLLILVLMIGGFTAFVSWRQSELEQSQQVFTLFSTHSSLPRGALGMFQWLERIGYRPTRIENADFEIGEDTRLLFMFAPTETIERNEALYILNWVERGNTLVLADDSVFSGNGLLDAMDVSLDFAGDHETIPLTQPMVDGTLSEVMAGAESTLEFQNSDYAVFASGDGRPILARIPRGSGTIWLTSAPRIFTNELLLDEDNAALAAALVASAPKGSEIAFDEYHLGFQAEEQASLGTAVYNTPWGWSLIFLGLALFGYLAFNGRRFGRILPVPKTLARRSPSEYVTSMGNLFRRANKRGMVLQHYRHSLKRRLGRPYHLNPELEDSRYIEMLERLRPDLDRAELTHILNSLRRTDTTEADLVRTIEKSVNFGNRDTKPTNP